jgi:hypothetical protein
MKNMLTSLSMMERCGPDQNSLVQNTWGFDVLDDEIAIRE